MIFLRHLDALAIMPTEHRVHLRRLTSADHVARHSHGRYVCELEVKRASQRDGRPDRRHV
jgi:hypothetical protein